MKLEYRGNQQDGINVPDAGISDWKPGEIREVPDLVAESLLKRADEFEAVAVHLPSFSSERKKEKG